MALNPFAVGKLWQDAFAYGVDSLQRSVLF